MYVYKQTEPGLFTVGFYAPDGSWEADSDHSTRDRAADRVAYLNGSRESVERRLELITKQLDRHSENIDGLMGAMQYVKRRLEGSE